MSCVFRNQGSGVNQDHVEHAIDLQLKALQLQELAGAWHVHMGSWNCPYLLVLEGLVCAGCWDKYPT